MRLLLTLLILASSVFSATDYVIAVFKIGDQVSSNPYLDGELIEIVDPNEQAGNFVLSDRMQTIFYCRRIALNKKTQYRNYMKVNGSGKSKCILRPNKLSKEEKELLRDESAIKPIQNIDESVFDFGDNLNSNAKVKDKNAWVGGSVTVGSDGDYATWALLVADLGTFTSDGTATQISNVTETISSILGNSVSSYTMILDGGNYKINHVNRIMYYTPESSTGTGIIKNFHTVRTADAAANTVPAIVTTDVSTSITYSFYNNKFDGGGFNGRGLDLSDNTPICDVYNNLFINYNGNIGSIGLKTTLVNTSTVISGNTFLNCDIGLDFNSQDMEAQNNASFCTSTDYFSTGSLTMFSKCASSDATGSEAGLQSLVANTVFQSTTSTDVNFLYPVKDEALYGAGANPTISGHDTYFNNYPIILGDVDIGANGLLRSAYNPHQGKYFRFGSTFPEWSRRKLRN